jgi:hypothetical protein
VRFPEPPSPFGPSSAGKRVADAINLHVAVLPSEELIRGRWVAVRLADGHTNGTAYDSRYGAVRDHHLLTMAYAYPRIPLDGCTPRMGETLLDLWRRAYDAGLRLDPAELAVTGDGLLLVTPFGRLM